MFPVGESKFSESHNWGEGTLKVHQGLPSLCFSWGIFLHDLTFPNCSKVCSHSSSAYDLEAGLSLEFKFRNPFDLWPRVCLIWKIPHLKAVFPSSEPSGL